MKAVIFKDEEWDEVVETIGRGCDVIGDFTMQQRIRGQLDAETDLYIAAQAVVDEWNSPHIGRTERDEAVEPLIAAMSAQLEIHG